MYAGGGLIGMVRQGGNTLLVKKGYMFINKVYQNTFVISIDKQHKNKEIYNTKCTITGKLTVKK